MSIGLRTVRLQTLDDNLVTIPNSRFITDIVASGNAGALDMMVVTDFHVDFSVDLEKVQEIIREVVVTSRYAYLKKEVSFTIEESSLGNVPCIRVRAKAYVLDVHYEKAFQSDIMVRVTHLFQLHKIPRPPR